MLVQVNSDSSISGTQELNQQIEETVAQSLERFGDQITRVELHLSDVNGAKTGEDDKKCVMEARPSGLQPVVVSHLAGSVEQAVGGALDKLTRALDSLLGRLNRSRGKSRQGGEQVL